MEKPIRASISVLLKDGNSQIIVLEIPHSQQSMPVNIYCMNWFNKPPTQIEAKMYKTGKSRKFIYKEV